MTLSISYILLHEEHPKDDILHNVELFKAKEAEIENSITDKMKNIKKCKNDLLGVVNLNLAHIYEFMKIEKKFKETKL